MSNGKTIGSVFRTRFIAVALLASLSLFACGGGGGESTAVGPGSAANSPPPLPGDTTPPTVTGTSPANAATGVALNTSYTATFSEAMSNATLTTASVKLATAGGTAVAGTVSVSGNTVTFNPSVDLAGSTQYTGTITTAAKDAAGNALGGNYTWSFTTAAAPVTPAPTVSLTANPTSLTSGGSSTLTWTSTNATSCTASGSWSGTKATSGSQSSGTLTSNSSFSLSCTGAGGNTSATAAVTVTPVSAPPSGSATGLDFPGSAAVNNGDTIRFRFLNPLARYPATYIWRAYPRRQAGYYTAFFWGNDTPTGLGGDISTFLWVSGGGADSYYGAHPYPRGSSSSTTQDWEISVEQADYVNGAVVYDRWYTQALVVWTDASGNKHHDFYWDLPNTDSAHMVSRTSPSYWGNRTPPVPVLTFGDAPWAPGNEVWDGMLRGFQVYSSNLSIADILTEVNSPLSTSSGAANIWYLNLNPTPSDISDKSGRGHNPSWVGNLRPTLWNQ